MNNYRLSEFAHRREAYALCARIFATEVDARLLEQLGSAPMRALFRELSVQALEPDLQVGDPRSLDLLAAEYCRLFIGPQPACPPFASVQRGEALPGGHSRARVQVFLEATGLVLSDHRMPIASTEHVAVQLALLRGVYDLAADSSRVEEERQRAFRATGTFLSAEVLPWMPRFLDQVCNATKRGVYRGAATLAANLLHDERALHGIRDRSLARTTLTTA